MLNHLKKHNKKRGIFLTIKHILFSFLVFVTITSTGQETKKSKLFSKIIEEVSVKWKADSLGQQNLRSKYSKKLRKSTIDNITTDSLVKYLGNPNAVWHSDEDTAYLYYTYSGTLQLGKKYYEGIIFYFRNRTLYRIGYSDNDPS